MCGVRCVRVYCVGWKLGFRPGMGRAGVARPWLASPKTFFFCFINFQKIITHKIKGFSMNVCYTKFFIFY